MRQRPSRAILAPVVVALLAMLVLALVPVAGAGEPARISLSREPDPSGAVRLLARVTDSAGGAVEGTAVTVLGRTAFGWLMLGEAETDARGTAAFTLPPGQAIAEVTAQAGEDQNIRAVLALIPGERGIPAKRPGRDVLRTLSPQPGFISPYPPPQLLILGVILGGIWLTYGFLVLHLVRIRRAP